MVKDHLVSKIGYPLPALQRVLFSISSKGSFIRSIPQTGHHIPGPSLNQLWSTGLSEFEVPQIGFGISITSCTRTETIDIKRNLSYCKY